MHKHDDPENLLPEERTREVARLLAAGFLRMRERLIDLEGPKEGSGLHTENAEETVSLRRERT
jgi:hypothetical protein